MGRKKTEFWESARLNNAGFIYYYNRLLELAISRFEWTGLPDTCDSRFLELACACSGGGLFVWDQELGGLLSLRFMQGGEFDVYGNSTQRIGWGWNGVQVYANPVDSVIVYNNMLKRPIMGDLEYFAMKLYNADRTVDVNIRAQKTPVLIICDESERLSMENLYKEFDGNAAVIFGKKSLSPDAIKAISTEAPFTAPQINELKNKIWNEALTYLGIYNVEPRTGTTTVEEVARQQGGVIASRFGGLEMRKRACEELNRKFGLNVKCEYRQLEYEDYGEVDGDADGFTMET